MLNAGSLPAQLTDEPISERTVGPQIGRGQPARRLVACIFGLVVVAVFLIGYYYLAGVVAYDRGAAEHGADPGRDGGVQRDVHAAGVAGIVLTIGMAVDANVLIFERLREEQQRGLSLRMALRNAYDRAWSAILDGNVTPASPLLPFLVGTEEVKGFGLTLLIGILSSLFTALFVTLVRCLSPLPLAVYSRCSASSAGRSHFDGRFAICVTVRRRARSVIANF